MLLANLLQQRERLGCDPGFVRGEKAVELGDAEGIGADRGHPRVLARASHRMSFAAVGGLAGHSAGEACEGVELRGVVTGREHECGILVQRGDFQHRGRHGSALTQAPRCSASPRG